MRTELIKRRQRAYPGADHTLTVDRDFPIWAQKPEQEESKAPASEQVPVLDTCDFGHKFAKLPDHPKKSGRARCVYCLALGFDSMCAAIRQGAKS